MNLVSKTFSELAIKELYEILKSRSEIFIMEQNIHYQDMDNVDYNSLHCFFFILALKTYHHLNESYGQAYLQSKPQSPTLIVLKTS